LLTVRAAPIRATTVREWLFAKGQKLAVALKRLRWLIWNYDHPPTTSLSIRRRPTHRDHRPYLPDAPFIL
jgi:hypothetical protein